VRVCAGWDWEGAWQVDKSSGEVDDEGWSYGSDFSILTYPPAPVIFCTNLQKIELVFRTVACQNTAPQWQAGRINELLVVN